MYEAIQTTLFFIHIFLFSTKKGNFADYTAGPGATGTGHAFFRSREGFIDVYDKFDAKNMSGHLVKYAGSDNLAIAKQNAWGDLSERDFKYYSSQKSGSVFFGADENIMMNYGFSNECLVNDIMTSLRACEAIQKHSTKPGLLRVFRLRSITTSQ